MTDPQPNPTLGETLIRLTGLLEEVSIPDARLETEALLAHVLQVSRTQILAHPERPLAPEEERALSEALRRRLDREPLAYITGAKEFFGIDLTVDPSVLIPRPETETLVETALKVAREFPGDPELSVVDVGTGSGAIAVALAVHLPTARIFAVDSSVSALAVAEANAEMHEVADRITFLEGDLLAPIGGNMDLIVANLPYVRSDELSSLPPEVQREPMEALDGGEDGLNQMRRLMHQAQHVISGDGVIMLEIDPRQAEPLLRMGESLFPGAEISISKDMAGRDRVFMLR